MSSLDNTTPLTHKLHAKSGKILLTIGDAAMFIKKLPSWDENKFHWQTARESRPRSSGQISANDKWRPAGFAVSAA